MALDSKKKAFGFNMEERFQKQENTGINEHEYTPTDTVTPAHEYAPAYTPNKKVKERKTERLQLLVRASTKARLAKYAEDHNTSSNEVVQRLLDSLLDREGY